MYIKTLHFKDNEIMDFLAFCETHEDIEYKWNKIKDKQFSYSVHMKYSKERTNKEIYKMVDKLRK